MKILCCLFFSIICQASYSQPKIEKSKNIRIALLNISGVESPLYQQLEQSFDEYNEVVLLSNHTTNHALFHDTISIKIFASIFNHDNLEKVLNKQQNLKYFISDS